MKKIKKYLINIIGTMLITAPLIGIILADNMNRTSFFDMITAFATNTSIDEPDVTIEAVRSSHTDATIYLTSNFTGCYYYEVKEIDENMSISDKSKAVNTLYNTEQIIYLDNLTAGAKLLYIFIYNDSNSTKAMSYTVNISEYIPAPILTAGASNRIDTTNATVKFTSDKEGQYYYEVVDKGAARPIINTNGKGVSCGTSEQTINLTTLYNGSAKDVWVVVKNKAGNVSEAVKIEIPAVSGYDDIAPILTAGIPNRTGDANASVKFTSNEDGLYFYEVVDRGAAQPPIDTSGVGISCDTTEQTINLTNLTAGAKDIYIVVKDVAGNVSAVLKIEIPAFNNGAHSNNPGENNPGENNPGENNPGENNPGENNPGENNPGENNPGENNPGESNSGENNPGENNPGENNPGENNPGENNPGEKNPGKNDPSENKPSEITFDNNTSIEEVIEELNKMIDGSTVVINLSDENTTLTKEVFESIAGKDITITVNVGNVTWEISGIDVSGVDLKDINLGVNVGTDTIPINVVNPVSSEFGTIQISLEHEGPFGFTMKLIVPLGSDNAGYYANLYYYNKATGKMEFRYSARIGEDGNVSLIFTGASDYAIFIDNKEHFPTMKSPKTSDISSITISLLIITVSVLGLATTFVRRSVKRS